MFKGKEWIGFLLGLLASVIFASFYIIGRLVFGQYDADPVAFTFIRFALAAPAFALYAVFSGSGKPLAHAFTSRFWPMLGLALSGIVGEGLLLMASLKYTTAARSSLFANTSPILTVFLAYLFMREPMGRKQWLGMLAGFAGILLAIFSRSKGDLFMAVTSWGGDLLALASAFCWAVFTVLGRRLVDASGGLVSGAASMIIGAVLLMLLSLFFPYPWQHFGDWRFWAYAVYAGIIVSGLGNILWIVSLKHLEAGRLGAMGYISCILAMGGSFFCLQEKLDAWFAAGAALVFAGVYWMMHKAGPGGRT
ncbi:MAG: DMT family transporter [Kiritimatiellia bacterium]